MRAVCIGECMVEMRPVADRQYARGFAGDAYNTAVYLKRALGPAHEVAFLTAVGDDAMSAAMTAEFAAQGLATDRVAVVPRAAPGLYLIELDAAGDRSFLYWRGQSAARQWLRTLVGEGGAESLAGSDLVYVSGISLAILEPGDRAEAIALLASLKGRVGRLAFDPNLRLRLWEDVETARTAIEAMAAVSDIVLPSQQDGELLWDVSDARDAAARWAALGAGEVALTLAEQGAWLRWPGGETGIAAPIPEAVIDTSGAGDSFNGAYLAARLQGSEPPEAARRGVAQASRVIAQRGAIISA